MNDTIQLFHAYMKIKIQRAEVNYCVTRVTDHRLEFEFLNPRPCTIDFCLVYSLIGNNYNYNIKSIL